MLSTHNTFTADLSTHLIDSIVSSLGNVPDNAVIFIDVDDTLITPLSNSFRASPHKQLIDHIKNNKEQYPNHEAIISHWRRQRRVMLVDSSWPETIHHLKKKHRVYGLTKMDTGQFGVIDSIEQWRFNELERMGITFSQNETLQKYAYINNQSFERQPSFYGGIFFTGSASKGNVLFLYQEILNAPFMVLIDDREEQLHDVSLTCQQLSLPFMGIHFKGAQELEGQPDPAISGIQKHYLLTHNQWLEDDEAKKMLLTQEI